MSDSSAAKPGWRLIPHFLLRRAGFPLRNLEALACPRSAALALEIARLESQREKLRHDLLRRELPLAVAEAHARSDRPALRALSAWRRRVGRWRVRSLGPGEWSPTLRTGADEWVRSGQTLVDHRAELTRLLDEELLASRQALRALFQVPRVREALFLLSPDLVEASEARLDRAPSAVPGHEERAFERRLYTFVQRLCAKNETTSFFGPLAYGRVDRSCDAYAFGEEAPAGVTRREAFFAFWAATTLAARASADAGLLQALPVRRVAVASVAAGVARRPDGRRVPVDEACARLFAAIDERQPLGALARIAGLTAADAEVALQRLEKHGLVRRTIEPLSTTPHPLRDVIDQLPDVPEAATWRAALEGFESLLRRFEAGDLAERRSVLAEAEQAFTRLTGVPARRAAGSTYADRTILYEDCLGDMQPVLMPQAEADRLERAFSPTLEIGGTFGVLRYRAVRTLATRVLDGMGGHGSFLDFAEQMDARVRAGELEPLLEPSRRFKEAFSERVRQASDGRVAVLAPADLVELVAEDAKDSGRFASPDVMLQVQEGGPPQLVIGEVHPYMFAWGSQGYFSPTPEQMQAACAEDLGPWGGRERIAMVLRRRRHKGLVTQAFPGTFIEVTGRGTDDARRRVAIADLEVRVGEAGPALHGPQGELVLYVGEDDHPHLRAFAPPQVELPQVRMGARTPRIVVGELVYQRERWDVPEGELNTIRFARSPSELAVAVAAARTALDWPRHVFAMSPHEPKPICLDLEVPFAQSMLQRLLSLGRLGVSEMLPSPDGLWLKRASGAHTSELRIAMVRRA